ACELPFENARELRAENSGRFPRDRDFRLNPPDQPRRNDPGFFLAQPIHVTAPMPSLARQELFQRLLLCTPTQFPRLEVLLLLYCFKRRSPILSFRFWLPHDGHQCAAAVEPSFGDGGLVFQRE